MSVISKISLSDISCILIKHSEDSAKSTGNCQSYIKSSAGIFSIIVLYEFPPSSEYKILTFSTPLFCHCIGILVTLQNVSKATGEIILILSLDWILKHTSDLPFISVLPTLSLAIEYMQ